ncbi:MAG: ATP/GTP-binding protein [Candidatus Thorarchaeota archaeon]|nr:ATP/GTP-binding protein [Candidatus Thorarchaeota archaeon]
MKPTEELKAECSFAQLVLNMFFVFLVGTAGSGKSLLTASFEKWLVGSDLSVTVVNIDPGVDNPPYTSDIDIREYVDYGEVMNNFGLGPNGALVASLDMGVSSVDDLREEIIETERDYVLVDCPGQMELFAYRNSGPLMVSGLRGDDTAVSLYLLDSNIARTPTGYLSSMLLGLSINIRFGLPQLNLLSKSDIIMEDEIEEIVQWGSEINMLEQALDQSSEGLIREYSKSILDMLESIGIASGVIPISAKDMTGFDILYGELQRIFSGGDNLYE